MLVVLVLSVIANAFLTLGVCWLLFRNGEVIREARRQSTDEGMRPAVTAEGVWRWLQTNRDRVAIRHDWDDEETIEVTDCQWVSDTRSLIIRAGGRNCDD